jgi:hypothetical protein
LKGMGNLYHIAEFVMFDILANFKATPKLLPRGQGVQIWREQPARGRALQPSELQVQSRWDAKGRQKPTVEVLAFLLPSVGSHWKVLSRFRTPLTVSTVAAHRSGGLGGDGIGSWESDSRESRGRCHHLGLLASASRACRNWECPRMPACGGPTAQVWPTAEELD